MLREARSRAGLTQRELAERARTSQSVVARIEGGRTDPSLGTLARLVSACGFEVFTVLEPMAAAESHKLTGVARI